MSLYWKSLLTQYHGHSLTPLMVLHKHDDKLWSYQRFALGPGVPGVPVPLIVLEVCYI